MAGQVVACPHCRGQFQMPDKPPAGQPTSPVPPLPPAPPRTRTAHSGDAGLSFENESAPYSPGVKAELDSYRAAEFLALVLALLGSVAVLLMLGLSIYTFVLPILRGTEGGPGRIGPGLLWLVSSFLFAGLLIVALFLFRALALVIVDAARTLRAIDRDALAASRKKS